MPASASAGLHWDQRGNTSVACELQRRVESVTPHRVLPKPSCSGPLCCRQNTIRARMYASGRWRTPSTSPTGVRTRTCGLTGLPPRRNAPFGVGERDSTPLHAKGGLEEFGRLVGDTAQSAGAMQVNHRGVAADAGFCRSAPGALRVSFASKSIHAVLAPRAYGT